MRELGKNRLKVVCDSKIPFLKGAMEPFGVDCRYLPPSEIDAAAVRDADALIVRTRTKCNAGLLEGSTVRFIATATIGFDHLDVDYLAGRGIVWRSAPGCNAKSVAQYVGAILSRVGWRGKTIGIVGVGHVGSQVAELAAALGMTVLLNDPPRAEREGGAGFVALERLLAASDIVSMHVPDEPSTRDLAGGKFFAAMKSGALFVNSSRGSVVDEAALSASDVDFVLDVWKNEPAIRRDLMAGALFSTPHIAGYSTDGKANGTGMAVRALAEFFQIDMLRDFKVTAVPPPENPVIDLDGMDGSAAVAAAILHSYDVERDSLALRAAPETFERLRNDYWLRREFPAFTVVNAGSGCRDALRRLGFKMQG